MQAVAMAACLRLQNRTFADRLAYVSDPSCGHVPTGKLLSEGGSLKESLIDEETRFGTLALSAETTEYA